MQNDGFGTKIYVKRWIRHDNVCQKMDAAPASMQIGGFGIKIIYVKWWIHHQNLYKMMDSASKSMQNDGFGIKIDAK